MQAGCRKADEAGHDILFHVLYSSDHALVMQLCMESAQRLTQTCQTRAAADLFELSKHSHHMAVCVFFMLLNADAELRATVCREFTHPTAKVRFPPLCGHKAPGFFRGLHKYLVPDFLRNECKNSLQFEEDIRVMYQCS
jgi:hypothetical protein